MMSAILQHVDPCWASCHRGWITDNGTNSFTFGITKMPLSTPISEILLNQVAITIGLVFDKASTTTIECPQIKVRLIPHQTEHQLESYIGYVPKRISRYVYDNLARIKYGIISEIRSDFTKHVPVRLKAQFFYEPSALERSLTWAILQEKLAIQEEMNQDEVHCLRV